MSGQKESSKIIRLAHGAGGVLQEELIKFVTKDISFKNIILLSHRSFSITII